VAALAAGRTPARPPYLPLIGRIAAVLGQVDEAALRSIPRVHATAVLETASALGADVVSVGLGMRPEDSLEALRRVTPLLGGRATAACLAEPEPAAVRAHCEAGADMVLVVAPTEQRPQRYRTAANLCRFYGRPLILVDPAVDDCAALAAELGCDGAVVATPTGSEPGIVGGGLGAAAADPVAPRADRFFWAFAGEVPADLPPEALAQLGAWLTR
jgi:sugar phosphate isomerase/epimerase